MNKRYVIGGLLILALILLKSFLETYCRGIPINF